MVRENGENSPDGAGEKMLLEEDKKVNIKGELGEVKFASGELNGDAKIDILEVRKGFTGLTKEELMKYSTDPFWVRLRWFMFIAFWLVWVGMLAGAIVIIVGAPKCALPPPKTWWEQGPILELESPADPQDGPAYLSLDPEQLSSLGVRAVIMPQPISPEMDAYSVVNPEPKDVSAFKEFAAKAKKNDVRVIVEITPNYVSKSSEWFIQSEADNGTFGDYFVWSAGTVDGPPNNWASTQNQPAWERSAARNKYYLHQFSPDTPDLNFRNSEVVREFDKVLKFWAENGASGFRLSKVKHLLVDKDFKDEAPSKNPGSVTGDYDFNSHKHTTYQEGLADILVHWRQVVRDNIEDGVLTLTEDLGPSSQSLKLNGSEIVVDLPRASRALDPPAESLSAESLHDSLAKAFYVLGNESWPTWQYSTADGNQSSELNIISMLLPGVPIVSMNQILTPGENSTKATDEYNSLLALRAMPSMLHGAYHSYLLANNTVFGFTRLKSGNPGCMVLYNPSDSLVSVDLKGVEGVPPELTVVLPSANYNVKDVVVKSKLASSNVPVSSRSAIVLTYVPDKKE